VWAANPQIVAHLHDTGFLLNRPGETLAHSYAHCWRCKGPLLFRATPQWFVAIDHAALRERALAEIDATRWIPPWGRDRIHGMIANRPDWCLSRQRVWGVPIPAFYCEGCGQVTADPAAMEHVADLFEREGADAWYLRPAAELVPPGFRCGHCGGAAWRPETDIVDVWFESGCSWLAVAGRDDPALKSIDLYLEGSDQHRGWFHSSLLVGIGVTGRAPYRAVLTHGWVLDEDGHPYSKSAIEEARRRGKKIKFVPPEEFIAKNGAELFRLWAASTDFRSDIPFSDALIAGLGEWYRKLRNTCRFMLANLYDFRPDDHPLDRVELDELDQYILSRLGHLVDRVRRAYDEFEFHAVHRALVDFVTAELSALYLDVVKDRLYADSPDARARRATQAVIYATVRAIATMTAPILCFTAEEIWKHMPRRQGDPDSVHLAEMPVGKPLADDDPRAADFAVLFDYCAGAKVALEQFRAQKHKSVDARVTVRPRPRDRALLAARLPLLADLLIVSDVVLGDDAAGDPFEVTVEQHPGTRCDRCWKWYTTMSARHPELCNRCSDAVAGLKV